MAYSTMARPSCASDAGGTLTIGQGITVRGRGALGRSDGGLLNQGTIRADVAGGLLDIAGQGWSNVGTLEATSSGTLRLHDSWANTSTGIISASDGTIGALAAGTNQGLLKVGKSAVFTCASDLVQTSTGVLEVELGGTTPSLYGSLDVTGQATIDGTLHVTLNGFSPASGDQFQVLTASPVLGPFATTDLPPEFTWNVSYPGTAVILDVQ